MQPAMASGPVGKLRATAQSVVQLFRSLLSRKRSVAEPGQPRACAGDPRGVGATTEAFGELRALGDIGKVDAQRLVALLETAAPRYVGCPTQDTGPLDAIAPAFREYLATARAADAQDAAQVAQTLNDWGTLLVASLGKSRELSPQANATLRALALGWLQRCADAAAEGAGTGLNGPTLQAVLEQLIDTAHWPCELNQLGATLGLLDQVPSVHRPAIAAQTRDRAASRATELALRNTTDALQRLPQLLASASNADALAALVALASKEGPDSLTAADIESIQACLAKGVDTATTVAHGRAELLATVKYIAWCLRNSGDGRCVSLGGTLAAALGLHDFAPAHGDDKFAGASRRHKAQIAALVARLQAAAARPDQRLAARELSWQLYRTAREQLQSVESRRQVPAFNDPLAFQSKEITSRRAGELRRKIHDDMFPTQILHSQSLQNLAKAFVKYLRSTPFVVNDVKPDSSAPLGLTAHRQRMEWAALLAEDLGNPALPERKRGISRQLALAWLDAFAQGAAMAAPSAADLRYLRTHGNCDTEEKLKSRLAREQLDEAKQAEHIMLALARSAGTVAEREALISRLPALGKTASACLREQSRRGVPERGPHAEALDVLQRLVRYAPTDVQIQGFLAKRDGLIMALKQRLLAGDAPGALQSALSLAMLAPPTGAPVDIDSADALRRALVDVPVPDSDVTIQVAHLLHYVKRCAEHTPGPMPQWMRHRLAIVCKHLGCPASPQVAALGKDRLTALTSPDMVALLARLDARDLSADSARSVRDALDSSYAHDLATDNRERPSALSRRLLASENDDKFAVKLGQHVQRYRHHPDLAQDIKAVAGQVEQWMKRYPSGPKSQPHGPTHLPLSADTVNYLKSIDLPALSNVSFDPLLQTTSEVKGKFFSQGVASILEEKLATLRALPAAIDAASAAQRQGPLAGLMIALLQYDELVYPNEQGPGAAAGRLGNALKTLAASQSDSELAREAMICLGQCAAMLQPVLQDFDAVVDDALPPILSTRRHNLRTVCKHFAPDTPPSAQKVEAGAELRRRLGSALGMAMHDGSTFVIAHTLPSKLLDGLFETMAANDREPVAFVNRGIAKQFIKDLPRTSVSVGGLGLKRAENETEEEFIERGCATLARHCLDDSRLTGAVSVEMNQRLIAGFLVEFDRLLKNMASSWHAPFIGGESRYSLPYSVKHGEINVDTSWQDERYVDVAFTLHAPVSNLFHESDDPLDVKGFYGLEYRVRIDREDPSRWESVGTPILTAYANRA